jgi:hypothetical protein
LPILHEKGHFIQEIPTTLPLSKKLPKFRMIALAQKKKIGKIRNLLFEIFQI